MTNFLLHRHRKEDLRFKLPEGLNELLSDISREVLRDQPQCVYSFVADYLEAMLMTREQTLIAERNRNTIFDISMTISDLMREVGISTDKAVLSARLIEATFKQAIVNDQHDDTPLGTPIPVLEASILGQLVSQCGFGASELQKVQRIIQACFKDYYFHEKEFTLKMNRIPFDHWANKAEKTLEIYRQCAPPRWELERAAVCIQSAYRGYYSRKVQRDIVLMNEKATKIQALYRGHAVRRQLCEVPNKPMDRLKPLHGSVNTGAASKIDSFLVNRIDGLNEDHCELLPSAAVKLDIEEDLQPEALIGHDVMVAEREDLIPGEEEDALSDLAAYDDSYAEEEGTSSDNDSVEGEEL